MNKFTKFILPTRPFLTAALLGLSSLFPLHGKEPPNPVLAGDKTPSRQNAYAEQGFADYKEHCGVCHAIKSPQKVAPTLSEVLTVYYGRFPDSAAFVGRVEEWVLNPVDSLSLLPGAILEHNRMPKLPYPEEQIKSIAKWMWRAATCPENPDEKTPKDLENC